jgi:phosphoribosylaminoimidazole-succinocarboxamide synthase
MAAPRRSRANAASSWPTPSSSSAVDGDHEILLADEVLTPDSSRFWPADDWQPGRAQPSYDKQIVRNWLLSPESGWDRASDTAPPSLSGEVVERTRARYLEAYERLTGQSF